MSECNEEYRKMKDQTEYLNDLRDMCYRDFERFVGTYKYIMNELLKLMDQDDLGVFKDFYEIREFYENFLDFSAKTLDVTQHMHNMLVDRLEIKDKENET